MTPNLRRAVVPAYLLLCLLFGGSSGAGIWANLFLQLLAIPIIIWSVLVRRSTPVGSAARILILIAVLAIVLVLLQLVPLPPSLWTELSGRERIAEGYSLLNQPLPWLPVSLAPYDTISTALRLLPPLAVLLGTILLGGFKTQWAVAAVILVTAFSTFIGVLQISGGGASPWYFYEITNYGASTGFFANPNNFGALLVITIPLVTALYVSARQSARSKERSAGLVVMLGGALIVVAVGVVLNTSLAGIGLSLPVFAGCLLMLRFRGKKAPAWAAAALPALVAAAGAVTLSGPFAKSSLLAGAQTSLASRQEMLSTSLQPLEHFFPIGSGLGTFEELYRWYENPDSVTTEYVNHAHNDYLQLVLEMGVPGLLLMALFLIWWLLRVRALWRTEESDVFARAATIATAALLAHSAVEFPLRAVALSTVFAFCCAIMTEPRPFGEGRRSRRSSSARHLSAD